MPSVADVPGFGFSQSTYWAKVILDRRTTREHGWMLEFSYAPMQWIDVYTLSETGQLTHQRGGSGVALSAKPYDHHKHVFELPLQAGARTTLLVRIDGESSKNIPLKLYRADVFAQESGRDLLVLGAYGGVIVSLLFYNLFIFITLREQVYFHYVAFLGSFLVFIFSINGLSQQLITPEQPQIGLPLLPASMGVVAFFGALFTANFLNVRALSGHRWIHRSLQLCATWGIVSFCLPWFASYHVAIICSSIMSLVFSSMALLGAVVTVRLGNRAARYYLIAWVTLLAGIFLYAARAFGVMPTNIITEYSVFYGSAIEAILLSVALAARMRSMKEESEHAQHEQLRAERAMFLAREEAETAREETLRAEQQALSHRQEALVQQKIALEHEKQLIEKEKLANIGLLSAGVAHEINNPNSFMRLSVQSAESHTRSLREFIHDLLSDEADPDLQKNFDARFDKILSQLALAQEGSERIATIVRSMRSASRNDAGDAVLFDPAETVFSTLELIRMGYRDTVTFDTSELIPGNMIRGFPSQINQVFTNLIVNACHAIEEKQSWRSDTQTIDAQRHDIARGTIRLSSITSSGDLIISVRDNGCGMTENVLAKLFQPFFTTKGAERGTGLGLGLCKGMIGDHGGRLDVESLAGEGTTFRVILPLATHAEAANHEGDDTLTPVAVRA
jgi:two-component system NtrC family sensor kinase